MCIGTIQFINHTHMRIKVYAIFQHPHVTLDYFVWIIGYERSLTTNLQQMQDDHIIAKVRNGDKMPVKE